MAQYEKNPTWRNDVDEIEIIRLFTKENMSLTAISKLMQLDRGVVKRRLEKNNITITRKPRSDKSKDNSPVIRKLLYKYQLSAEKRGYSFDIDYSFFTYLTQQNCYYCGTEPSGREFSKSGHEYIFNGLDRLDNNKGYSVENVVPCCKVCNAMKSNTSYDQFVKQIQTIANHLKKNELL